MAPDPFSILGVSPTFNLDPVSIQRAYLAMAQVLHPDLIAGEPDAHRQMALVNEARATLEDPERRAEALVLRFGGLPKEQDRRLPDGFLANMLEIRETIESEWGDPGRRAHWERWAEERRREAFVEIARSFADRGPSVSTIRMQLNALRYIQRLIEQLDRGDASAGA